MPANSTRQTAHFAGSDLPAFDLAHLPVDALAPVLTLPALTVELVAGPSVRAVDAQLRLADIAHALEEAAAECEELAGYAAEISRRSRDAAAQTRSRRTQRALLIAVLALGGPVEPGAVGEASAAALTGLQTSAPEAWLALTGALASDMPLSQARADARAAAPAHLRGLVDVACRALVADADAALAVPRVVVAIDRGSATVRPSIAVAVFGGTVVAGGQAALACLPPLLYDHDARVVCADPELACDARVELAGTLWDSAGDSLYADVSEAWTAAGALLEASG